MSLRHITRCACALLSPVSASLFRLLDKVVLPGSGGLHGVLCTLQAKGMAKPTETLFEFAVGGLTDCGWAN